MIEPPPAGSSLIGAASDLTAAIEQCHAAGWTDGLPVVPPTGDLVAAMLDGRDGATIVGDLPPALGSATLEKIAANAVMAGCTPTMFSTVVAAVRAACDPRLGTEDIVTSLYPSTLMVLVHGDAATRAGVAGGTGALGPGHRANAAIGRALQLCLRNLGGARLDAMAPKTLGHPGGFTFCFAENGTLSPWAALHTDRGFAPDDGAVTLYGADAPLCITDMGRRDPEAVLRTIVESITIPGTYNAFFRSELWLLMSPEHAHVMHDAGWSRDDVRVWLHEQAFIRAKDLRGRGLYGFTDDSIRPTWLDHASPDDPIRLTRRPEDVVIAVVGGPQGGYTAAVFGVGQSVTIEVVP